MASRHPDARIALRPALPNIPGMSHAHPDPSGPETAADAAAREALRVDPAKLEADSRLVLERFWLKLRDTMAKVPFVEQAVAAFYAGTDPRTPFRAKATLMGALAYFIMPADALPDFIALLGYTDDATVLMLAIKTVSGHMRPEHLDRARAWLLSHRAGPTSAEEVAAGPVIDHDNGRTDGSAGTTPPPFSPANAASGARTGKTA